MRFEKNKVSAFRNKVGSKEKRPELFSVVPPLFLRGVYGLEAGDAFL